MQARVRRSNPIGRPSCAVHPVARHTGQCIEAPESKDQEPATRLMRTSAQLHEGTVRRALAAVSSSNVVGGEITSTRGQYEAALPWRRIVQLPSELATALQRPPLVAVCPPSSPRHTAPSVTSVRVLCDGDGCRQEKLMAPAAIRTPAVVLGHSHGSQQLAAAQLQAA
ncbi:hypothetical protein OPT61_g9185 [Boeremia exigua]|uniref:Uncharacterized protein n=1 Tax=Boeremia exigua TaxID=749465 RepID=A0ACC2HV50_9PLEO|nr:hypothetical protein OPT61_g9185 [Boeremia exigua]